VTPYLLKKEKENGDSVSNLDATCSSNSRPTTPSSRRVGEASVLSTDPILHPPAAAAIPPLSARAPLSLAL
jgi:hypothetical protein